MSSDSRKIEHMEIFYAGFGVMMLGLAMTGIGTFTKPWIAYIGAPVSVVGVAIIVTFVIMNESKPPG